MKFPGLILIAMLCSGCSEPSQSRVDQASRLHDPDKMALTKGTGNYMECTHTIPDFEIGVISLADGDRVKYWFISHHASGDPGCTKFEFPDGSVRYLDGAFCCEVRLSKQQPANREELETFLDTREGINPMVGGS